MNPRIVVHKALLSMEVSRQEYLSELSFPSPEDLPNPGIQSGSPELQADSLPSKPPGKSQYLSGIVIFVMWLLILLCLCSWFSSVPFSPSVLSDSLRFQGLDFPVHHQLLELVQTHVHQVTDAIQPSHPLLSPSPPVLNLSQHQGLFK